MVVRASRDLKQGEELVLATGEGQAAREGRSLEELRRGKTGETKDKK